MLDKKIHLNRLTISRSDLLKARSFAEYILKKELNGKKSKEAKLIHLAFNTSAIISYSRPFSSNIEGKDKRPSPSLLSFDINKVLNEDEVKLHKQIINSRNTEYAHSDAQAYSMESLGLKDNLPGFTRNPFFELLTRAQIIMLITMIKNWINHIDKEKSTL